MPHNVSLIATIAAGFGLAIIFGYLAARLRMPPLVGYLLAGVAIGRAFYAGLSSPIRRLASQNWPRSASSC